MEHSILEHRYDLQYVLYLLALHRQLKARLPDYDYDQHVGGALYLFLRGTQSVSRGRIYPAAPRADRKSGSAVPGQALSAQGRARLGTRSVAMSLSPLPLEELAPLSRATDLVQLLERWSKRGWLRALDKAFVGFLRQAWPWAS